ncbi:MAG: transposase, partial [Marinobacter sp.]|nr:transposase [Marinobacter sp.]
MNLDGPVTLRLVRVDLPGGTTEVLATSLLDAQAFPAADFADLYHRRWGIETDYRRLKQTLNLENFSGRSPRAVQQDLHARVLLKNLALLMQTLQQPDIDRRHAHRKLRWQP